MLQPRVTADKASAERSSAPLKVYCEHPYWHSMLLHYTNVAPKLGDVLTRDPIDDMTPLTLSHYHISILSFSVNWTR